MAYDSAGCCTICGEPWDERHEKYGCPDEEEDLAELG